MSEATRRPSDPTPRGLIRVVALVVPALLGLGIAAYEMSPVKESDVYWHIRAGRQLLADWVFAGPDPWGTFATRTWVRHQWLPDLALARLHDVWGWPGVAMFLPLAMTFVFAAFWFVARRYATPLESAVLVVLALAGTSGSLTWRPQVLSFGFAAITAGAWYATSRDGRARWWLVPMTWLWACCHGFWFFVPALGLLVCAGMLLDRRGLDAVRRPLLVALASLGVAMLTPVGPRLLTAPFAVDSITGYIQEWEPAPPTHPAYLVTAGLLALCAAVWMRSRTRPTWTEMLLLALCAYLLVSHGRTIALAAATILPLAARVLHGLLPLADQPVTRREVVWTAAGSTVGLALALLLAPRVAAEPLDVPLAMSPRLSALPAGTVVCNDYAVGSWLLLDHPDLKPIIDGRTELYTVGDMKDYALLSSGSPGWEDVPRTRGCAVALVVEKSPMDAAFAAAGWQEIQQDGAWVLLGKP